MDRRTEKRTSIAAGSTGEGLACREGSLAPQGAAMTLEQECRQLKREATSGISYIKDKLYSFGKHSDLV